MEVTLLVQAVDDAFRVLENARYQAVGLLNTGCELTSDMQNVEKHKVEQLLKGAYKEKKGFHNFIVTFFILLVFWAMLSGKFDAFHLSLGVICSLVIAFISHDLLFGNVRLGNARLISWRFIKYIPWLFYQIILSNFHVAGLVLSPKMPIEPKILKFETKLESDISWVALANSITLTPGTITMDIKDGTFIVHALSRKVADDLDTGEMEDHVAHVFMEADHIYVQDILDMAQVFTELRRSI